MIYHLLNIFEPRAGSDLVRALPVTIASMQRAKREAEEAGLAVSQLAAAFEHEQHTIPDGFIATRPLIRSCQDVPELGDFPPLPFHRDLLERLAEPAAGDDILIYTNSDIAVQPHFYSAVQKIADGGLDCFTINRRTISGEYRGVEDLEEMYHDKGEPHPGADCFVFRSSLFREFELDEVVVGTALFDKMLLWNFAVFGKAFRVIEDKHLTFHIGNDMSWKNSKNNALRYYNRTCLKNMLEGIALRTGPLHQHKELWSHLSAPVRSPHARYMYELIGVRYKKKWYEKLFSQ